MGQIIIKDLEVFGNHGVYREENVLGQKFLISAAMAVDVKKVSKNDEITESVHYGDICEFITSFMKEDTYKLLETVTDKLATALLVKYDLIRSVELEIKKPWAPIALPIDTVSVKVNRGWHKTYIGLGSNMGIRENYLNDAVAMMEADPKCIVGKVSDFINTKPVGPVEQDDFLNGCMELDTIYTPYELLEFVHELENQANRERKIFWGPRTLDLDILLYDDLVMSDEDLAIPHPLMHERKFVLEPLMQIAPNAVHPLLKKRIREILY